ncbi:XdhC family protein [Shewanella gaetbuli]|uniref:XdhC family protein n=1 Tax=Shewanella gaetbuli TaxID=220752 RepID=A0A9X1ZKK4_9GAMM|nr:XdhC/CoxI family protein [Shewanella gaetbuli]MCL1144024.1 XdhC family protein [Shewanella gaetbuli]
MQQHFIELLDTWQSDYQDDWVLAILTHVQGSSYRKPGAMMFFHPLGKSLGMLSGGCLEADLRRHAQKAIQTQQVLQLTYDATDESDTSYELGCGGIVQIMMLPINASNHYLGLQKIYHSLNSGCCGVFQLPILPEGVDCSNVKTSWQEVEHTDLIVKTRVTNNTNLGYASLEIPLKPPVHLGIFGGGLDAQPVAQMAHSLGWQVTVFDERTAYARQYDFPHANIMKIPCDQMGENILASLDCAFVMNHNLSLDAKALNVLVKNTPDYIALLGPVHRRDKVLQQAKLSLADFNCFFSAPAGLALGGELPSSVALSMLSQCHGVLHKSKLTRLDEVML